MEVLVAVTVKGLFFEKDLSLHTRSCSVKLTPQSDENNEKVITDNRPKMRPAFKWGDLDGDIFTKQVKDAYEEMKYWRRNLLLLPIGNASKNYIDEMTWINENAIKDIVFKTLMINPNLLLQKR